jgi:EEF1A N-terminal glycine/lysine methyltransferase
MSGDPTTSTSALVPVTTSSIKPSFGLPDTIVHYRPPWPSPASDTKPELVQVTVPPAVIHNIFAHRQWRAGVLLSNMIASGAIDVHNQTVLELGAGTGLPSIIAAHSGARRVVSTDYDEPTLIARLRENIRANIPSEWWRLSSPHVVQVVGHTWGTASVEDLYPWDAHSRMYSRFDVVLCADLFWDTFSHAALVKTLAQVVHTGREGGGVETTRTRVYVVAGLHTGREVLDHFFRLASAAGFTIEGVDGDPDLYEWAFVEEQGVESQQLGTMLSQSNVSGSTEGLTTTIEEAKSTLDGRKRRFDALTPDGLISERNRWMVRATLFWNN